MSLVPEFELGLWNAWIFVLFSYLLILVLANLLPKYNERDVWWLEHSKKEKKLLSLMITHFVLSAIYSVFLPLKLGTAWFYIGFLIYLMGLIFVIIGMLAFATTPLDKPVTKWVFRISRNPMFLGVFFIYVSIGITCASWIFLLIATAWIILMDFLVVLEERFCLEKYGNAYREYMDRTPRWIGIPKSRKK